MKTVIIDNYDSFTYNLSHLIKQLGADVTVLRNDKFELDDLEPFDKIVLSPGPGIPSEAGLLLDVIKAYAGQKPMLGVCLGHQAIGEFFGGRLTNLSDVCRPRRRLWRTTICSRGFRKRFPLADTTRGWWTGRACQIASKSRPSAPKDRLWPCGTGRWTFAASSFTQKVC